VGSAPTLTWQKVARAWTIASVFSFLALLVGMVWAVGPLGQLWLTWLILGVAGTVLVWCIAFAIEGP
jgi:hypothetical protein